MKHGQMRTGRTSNASGSLMTPLVCLLMAAAFRLLCASAPAAGCVVAVDEQEVLTDAESVVREPEPIASVWDRAVCLISKQEGPGNPAPRTVSASGFLVTDGSDLFLVTAGHAARDTSAETRLLYRSVDQKALWVALKAFVKRPGDPWVYHPVSDIAVLKLRQGRLKDGTLSELAAIAFTADQLQSQVPERTQEVFVVGFPAGLGVDRDISPLVTAMTVASRLHASPAAWGAEQHYYASPAAAAGCSGGPVVWRACEGRNGLTDEHSGEECEATVVGMYVGVRADESGAKLSRIVPASEILSLLPWGSREAGKSER